MIAVWESVGRQHQHTHVMFVAYVYLRIDDGFFLVPVVR